MAIQDTLINLLPSNNKNTESFLGMLKSLLPFGQIWGFIIRFSYDELLQDTIDDGTNDIYQDTIDDGTNDIYQDTNIFVTASTKFGALLSAFASELYRFQERWFDLYRESIPGLSIELLPEWENQAGLPNECTINYENIPIEERQAYTHGQLFTDHSKGMSKEFLTDYSTVVGYEIEIYETDEFQQPFIVAPDGVDEFDISSVVGERLMNAGLWGILVIEILAGDDDPDAIARFKCQVEKLKGAHIQIIWI